MCLSSPSDGGPGLYLKKKRPGRRPGAFLFKRLLFYILSASQPMGGLRSAYFFFVPAFVVFGVAFLAVFTVVFAFDFALAFNGHLREACAAASLAIGTLKGEHET